MDRSQDPIESSPTTISLFAGFVGEGDVRNGENDKKILAVFFVVSVSGVASNRSTLSASTLLSRAHERRRKCATPASEVKRPNASADVLFWGFFGAAGVRGEMKGGR